jgi:hypothetical protein
MKLNGENHGSCRFNRYEKTGTNALQGNCSLDPVPVDLGLSGHADLIARNPYQCVLVADIGFLRAEQRLWLDNLYIRLSATSRTQQSSLVDCFGLNCNMWLTSVTMQGDTSGFIEDVDDQIGAVAVVGGQLYATGVGFSLQCPPVRFCTLQILMNPFYIMRLCV